jgi:hypothetical protein
VWYELEDGNGNRTSLGFAPIEEGNPFTKGVVLLNDSDNYEGREYSRTIEITQAQYAAMLDFGLNYP